MSYDGKIKAPPSAYVQVVGFAFEFAAALITSSHRSVQKIV
jgi:hypothetical protein